VRRPPNGETHENHTSVYNGRGQKVERWEVVLPEQGGDCGILVDLSQVKDQLVDDMIYIDEDGVEHRMDSGEKFKYTVYPLGYLKDTGNVQASTHLGFYRDVVDELNLRACETFGVRHIHGRCEYLSRGPHQLYNEISHKTRDDQGQQDVGRGHVTAALAGEQLSGNQRTTWQRSHDDCAGMLPVQRYYHKLGTAGYYIGLRSEPIMHLDVENIPPTHRTAR